MILLAGLVSNHRFEDDRTGYVGTLISVNEYKVIHNKLIVLLKEFDQSKHRSRGEYIRSVASPTSSGKTCCNTYCSLLPVTTSGEIYNCSRAPHSLVINCSPISNYYRTLVVKILIARQRLLCMIKIWRKHRKSMQRKYSARMQKAQKILRSQNSVRLLNIVRT